MSTIATKIDSMLNEYVSEFCSKVAEKFNLSESDLTELWTEVSSGSATETKSKPKRAKASSGAKAKAKAAGSNSESCVYILSRGEKKGQECGDKTTGDLSYCSKHKKHAPQPTVVASTYTLRRNPEIDNQHWHPESGTVFNEKHEAIGVYRNGSIEALNSDDLEVAAKHGFILSTKKDRVKQKVAAETVDSDPVETDKFVHLETEGKFWEATLRGSTVSLKWGKIGSDRTPTDTDYESPSAALKDFDLRVAKKKKEGYTETGSVSDSKTSSTKGVSSEKGSSEKKSKGKAKKTVLEVEEEEDAPVQEETHSEKKGKGKSKKNEKPAVETTVASSEKGSSDKKSKSKAKKVPEPVLEVEEEEDAPVQAEVSEKKGKGKSKKNVEEPVVESTVASSEKKSKGKAKKVPEPEPAQEQEEEPIVEEDEEDDSASKKKNSKNPEPVLALALEEESDSEVVGNMVDDSVNKKALGVEDNASDEEEEE